MTRRLALIAAAVLAITASVASYYRSQGDSDSPRYMTATPTRGDLSETVEASGRLRAVTTVQVGTQLSGTIQSLHADFNSVVRKGQVIARLDPSLLQAQLAQAEATIVRLEADVTRTQVALADAQLKLRRGRELLTAGLVPRADVETAESTARQAEASLVAARAQVTQARASLEQNRVNLSHTVITAPVDGIVISRSVDVGQTVAASMSAPTLFVIAKDLTAMQVEASVDESDIGRIEAGQPVSFRVDAYPEETFAGTVAQVRLEPMVVQNVVSYVTVIDVPNPDGHLKPGMTANVSIEIARADDVLIVPNAALRFQPPAETTEASAQAEGGGNRSAVPRPTGTTGAGRPRQVWTLRDGALQPVRLQTGISNGTMTAVLGGDLGDGTPVVTGLASATSAATPASTASPLIPQRPGNRGRASAGGGG